MRRRRRAGSNIPAEKMEEFFNKKYKFNTDLVHRYSGETLMVYNEKSYGIYELNAVSADIYTYLSENKPLKLLMEWLAEKYRDLDVQKSEEVIGQIEELLNRFISCEIIFIDDAEI